MSEEASSIPSSGFMQLRRIRRANTQYERLQRPEDIQPGYPIPSIEGWVLLITGLPETTTPVEIEDFLVQFKQGDPGYFGKIVDIKVLLNEEVLCVGCALVEVGERTGFERALAELNAVPFPSTGAPIYVAPAFLGEEEEKEADGEGNVESVAGEKRQRD